MTMIKKPHKYNLFSNLIIIKVLIIIFCAASSLFAADSVRTAISDTIRIHSDTVRLHPIDTIKSHTLDTSKIIRLDTSYAKVNLNHYNHHKKSIFLVINE